MSAQPEEGWYCPACGSTRIRAPAEAEWDDVKKQFVIAGVLDGKWCSNCLDEPVWGVTPT